MKFTNTVKLFAIGVMAWTATQQCLAQTESAATSGGPVSASDQQVQAIDQIGKQEQQKVDLFTGSFGYSIPIECAPARNGSEPHLGLGYSSAGDNGWCGMGWNLNIGYIERYTRDGVPIQYSTATPPAPMTKYDDRKGFILNLSGKDSKIFSVATNGTLIEYRAEVDTDFSRCFLDTSNNLWTVYDKSGNTYYFGETSNSCIANPKPGWSGYSGTFHWALDQIVTASGDWTTVTYASYISPNTGLPERTLYPTQISYNGHTNVNGYTANFTGPNTITFQTELRPNDWHFSYRWGFRTEQCRRLTQILCQAGSQNVWKYGLQYGVSAATGRSMLTNMVLYGFDVNSNAVAYLTNSFAYQGNPNGVSFGPTMIWSNLVLNTPGTTSGSEVSQVNSGYTVADLVDIDGDGLPDRVTYDDSVTPNQYQVQKNLGLQSNGMGSFGSLHAFGPTSTGGGTTASSSNPFPDGSLSGGGSGYAELNTPYGRFRDINGDGLPDRVMDYWAALNSVTVGTPYVPYTNYEVQLNTGQGFSGVTSWPVSTGPLGMNDANTLFYFCVESGGVNVGFFDINGDGLPDRVMSGWYLNGAMTNFMVQLNTGTNFTQPMIFGPYHSQNWNGSYPPQSTPYAWAGIETSEAHMIDINGDGLPDRLMYPMDPNNPGKELHPTTYYAVEYNDGYSFESTNFSTNVPAAYDQWPGGSGLETVNGGSPADSIVNLPYVGLFDVNGDGLPDRVMVNWAADTNSTTSSTTTSWLVFLNNGHGFNSTPIVVTNIENQLQYSQSYTPDWWSMQGSASGYGMISTLMDINGDGLLDRVMAVHYDPSIYPYIPTAQYFLVQLNQGPFPDLLTNINNGIGGNFGIAYASSSAYDNRVDTTNPNSVSHMPFPHQVTASVTAFDGINLPQTTTYGYGGGFYDGARRELHGFAVVTNTDPTLRYTVTYFHTGGGRNYSSLGEYQDTNSTTGAGNFAKAGMPYRTETYGNDNALYRVQVNQVDQASLGNGRYFPLTTLSFDCDYPGPLVTATSYAYDPSTGNLTNKIEYGQVSGFSPTSVGTFSFTDTDTTDTRYYNTHFTAIGSYIIDHPDKATLTDTNYNIIRETDYSYNSGGTLASKQTRISAGYYAVNSYGYNLYGLATLATNPVGVVTETTYDSTYNTYPATTRLRAVPSNDSTGDFITTTTYDARSGQLAVSTAPSGLTISNSFDNFLRPTETDKIPIGGGTVVWMKKYTYPVTLKAIVSGLATNYADVLANDGVGGVESRTFIDGFGRPIQTRTQGENGNYRMVATAYDPRGVAFLTTWPSFVTSINYSKPTSGLTASWTGLDAAGRFATNCLVNVTFSNGAYSSESPLAGDTGSPLAACTRGYVYNSSPWWIVCTDEDGQVCRYGLDAFGRTNQIQELDGGNTYTTTLKYDLAGNLTNIINANSENIYWAYNDAGGMVAMADPYLGQWTYVRDYAGRLRVQTDARGNVISNSYVAPTGYQDAMGRLQAQTAFSLNYSNHVLIPAFTNKYIYDSSDDGSYTVYPGLIYKVIDSQGWEKNSYDKLTRTIKASRYLNVNSNTYTTSYTFDDGDNVTSLAYPNSGPTITNLYFNGRSLKQASRSGGGNYYTVSASAYDEFQHVTNFTYGSGLTTTRSYYSTSKRLQSISAGSSGAVFNRTYKYTAGNDITNIIGTGLTNVVNVAYYNLHRIKTYSGLSNSYAYDPVGNITTNIEGGGSKYAYANPRIQAVRTAFGYTNLYDLCGNMMVRHGGLTNSQALVYDAANRLSAIAQAGVMSDEFGYANDGSRLWKRINQNPTNIQVWIGNIYEEKGGRTLFHVYANGQQVCTFETNSLLYGGTDTNRVADYYHEDNLNTSSTLSSSSGAQQEVNVYYPFGRTQTASPQASFQVSRRFTGQVFDAESGLYYYNARYYDPELGRFIQPDDIIPDFSNPQSYNRYSYCVNDPLRYTDPTGHYSVSEWWDDTEEGADLLGDWFSSTAQSAAKGVEHLFMGDTSANWDPNSYNTLNGGTFGPELTDAQGNKLGNAATAPVKAGAKALVQAATMATPVGEEEAAGVAVQEAVQVETKVAASLEARAKELHGLLDPRAQRMRTTAVTETKEGVTYVGSSENALSKAQKAALKPGEVAAEGPGHAEVTTINAAKQAGHTPTATAASRPICPSCAQTIKQEGVTPASPLKKP